MGCSGSKPKYTGGSYASPAARPLNRSMSSFSTTSSTSHYSSSSSGAAGVPTCIRDKRPRYTSSSGNGSEARRIESDYQYAQDIAYTQSLAMNRTWAIGAAGPSDWYLRD